MTKWDYRFVWVQSSKEADAQREAQRLGADGWELVNCEFITSGYILYFKRPIPS